MNPTLASDIRKHAAILANKKKRAQFLTEYFWLACGNYCSFINKFLINELLLRESIIATLHYIHD